MLSETEFKNRVLQCIKGGQSIARLNKLKYEIEHLTFTTSNSVIEQIFRMINSIPTIDKFRSLCDLAYSYVKINFMFNQKNSITFGTMIADERIVIYGKKIITLLEESNFTVDSEIVDKSIEICLELQQLLTVDYSFIRNYKDQIEKYLKDPDTICYILKYSHLVSDLKNKKSLSEAVNSVKTEITEKEDIDSITSKLKNRLGFELSDDQLSIDIDDLGQDIKSVFKENLDTLREHRKSLITCNSRVKKIDYLIKQAINP